MKRAWIVVCIRRWPSRRWPPLRPLRLTPSRPTVQHGWFWQMPQPAAGLNDVTFAAAGQLWAVGVGGTIEHSTDGGAHLGGGSRPAPTPTSGRSASPTPSTAGSSAASATTDDAVHARHHRRRRRLDRRHAGRPERLAHERELPRRGTHGWVGTATASVLKTSDGGATWQTLTAAAAYKGYLTVDFVDATHGWAGGTRGRIWTTVDGGAPGPAAAARPAEARTCSLVQLDFVDRYDGWVLAQDD